MQFHCVARMRTRSIMIGVWVCVLVSHERVLNFCIPLSLIE